MFIIKICINTLKSSRGTSTSCISSCSLKPTATITPKTSNWRAKKRLIIILTLLLGRKALNRYNGNGFLFTKKNTTATAKWDAREISGMELFYHSCSLFFVHAHLCVLLGNCELFRSNALAVAAYKGVPWASHFQIHVRAICTNENSKRDLCGLHRVKRFLQLNKSTECAFRFVQSK